MNTTRVQVVVAHPDDETFACGSLLLHAADAGAETAVCCATRGEAGGPRQGIVDSGLQLGEVREVELHAAAAALNVSQVDLLEFTDSGMSGDAAPDCLVGAPFGQVVDSVGERLADFRPDVVVTLDASDGHRDHELIRDATLIAAERHGVPRVYLHCLPRSLIRKWVTHMQLNRPDMEHLNDAGALGTPDADITTVIDTTRYLAAREKAIALHASQLSPFEGLPDDLRRAFLTSDHLRRVKPSWTQGSPRESGIFG